MRRVWLWLWLLTQCVNGVPEEESNAEVHPDPNDEDYEHMIYVGRLDSKGRRVGFDQDNSIRYIFGTSLDDSHKEWDSEHWVPVHDLPERKTREEVLKERRHKNASTQGPKAYGHVDTHPLDGGVLPPKVVQVEPFFLDQYPVTNQQFGKFVKSTYYQTEAEKYQWSFVLDSFATADNQNQRDPHAEHWIAVDGAYWRRPEGPTSTYKLREHHPVTHVSHRDAAEYCTWLGKRLPGEWEWEAAARAFNWGPTNRTRYIWGDQADWHVAAHYANLWGPAPFPEENAADDGWRGTSPVGYYPPNALGFYDMTGNVWEWMRGGKHKARIVRGGSYIDTIEQETLSEQQHVATLGARATLHGTTTTGNLGFRCAKSPRKRTTHHYVWHDTELHGELQIEDQYGKRDRIPQRGWEDQFGQEHDDDELELVEGRPAKKRKVVHKRERLSTEL